VEATLAASSPSPSTPRPHHPLRRDAGRRRLQDHGRGTSWRPMNTGLACGSNPCSVLALAPTTPSTLYAGTSDNGVFKTTDGGTSWRPMNTGLACGSNPCGVRALALDPTTPSTLYAGSEGGGVFKTTDGARSWRPMNTGLACGPSLFPMQRRRPRPRPDDSAGPLRRDGGLRRLQVDVLHPDGRKGGRRRGHRGLEPPGIACGAIAGGLCRWHRGRPCRDAGRGSSFTGWSGACTGLAPVWSA